jgi:hypothetical protein
MNLSYRHMEEQSSMVGRGSLQFMLPCRLGQNTSPWILSPQTPQTKLNEHLFFVRPNRWQRKHRNGFEIYRYMLTILYPALVVIGNVNISCVRKMNRRGNEFTSLTPINPWYEIFGKGKLDLISHHRVRADNSPGRTDTSVSLDWTGLYYI